MAATFNGNPSSTIISCYSPTNVREETDLIAFYKELSPLVRSNPKLNVLVIRGGMNALFVKNVNHKHSLHNSTNRNWEHLTDFTLENRKKMPQYKISEKKGKTMDLHLRK